MDNYTSCDISASAATGSSSFDPAVLNCNFLIPSADNVVAVTYDGGSYVVDDDGGRRDSDGNNNNNNNNNMVYYLEDDDVFTPDDTGMVDNVENCENVAAAWWQAGVSDNQVLMDAAYESYRSKQLTPLLKHELKYFIQSRRLSQGKTEMEVQFEEPTTGQLRSEELERIERRRQQNRMAARRFRQKRKSSEESLLQTIEQLHRTNAELTQKALQLRKEKEELMEIVATHLVHCPSFQYEQLGNFATDGIP